MQLQSLIVSIVSYFKSYSHRIRVIAMISSIQEDPHKHNLGTRQMLILSTAGENVNMHKLKNAIPKLNSCKETLDPGTWMKRALLSEVYVQSDLSLQK